MKTIRLNHLDIGYRKHPIETDLNGEVYRAQLTCLLGTNGVGKSTLLRTIAGLQPALGGEVRLYADEQDGVGKAVQDIKREALARMVSVVLTEQPAVHQFTVREMVAMGRMPYTGFLGVLSDDDEAIVEEALALTGITAFASRQFDALSDGERQKVMIAKAMAQQTNVILLDEPTAFLDYPSKVELMKMLRRLAAENDKTIVLSTHDLELAHQYGDRLLTLRQGLREMDKEELSRYISGLK